MLVIRHIGTWAGTGAKGITPAWECADGPQRPVFTITGAAACATATVMLGFTSRRRQRREVA